MRSGIGKNSLALLFTILLVSVATYLFYFTNQQSAFYKSVINQLDRLLVLDQRIGEKLALSRSNLLPNYDELNQHIRESEALIVGLSEHQYKWPTNTKNFIEEVSKLKSEFNAKKERVEFIKSDVAVINNSTIYLPILIFQSQSELSGQNASSDLTKALEQIIRTLNLKNNENGYYDRSPLYINAEKFSQIEDKSIIEHISLINKHLETIFRSQKQVAHNLSTIEEMNFHGHLKQLSSKYVEYNQQQQQHIQRIALLLAIVVVGLISATSFAFLRLRKQRHLLQSDNIQRKKINHALAKLAKFSHHDSSREFYELCVQSLAEASNIHIAFVSFFSDESKNSLITHSVWVGDELGDNFSYLLKGGPCESVLQSGECFVEQNLLERFPGSAIIAELGMQSYFGKILTDPQSNPIGLIGLMDPSPTPAEDWLKSLLSVFATRISIEIEKSRNIEALFKEKEQAITTLNSIADGVISTNESGVVTRINQAAQQVLGIHEKTEGIGLQANQLFKVQKSNRSKTLVDPVDTCLTTRKPIIMHGQSLLITQTGVTLALQLSAAPVINAHDKLVGVVVVLHDVSQERELQAQLAYQANHDSLTGLVNRKSLESELKETLANFKVGIKHSLLYIDLDRFKIVNDTCGHKAGDELLRKFAKLLLEHARGSDVVARLGGDEFFILLRNCPAKGSHSIAKDILSQIEQFRFFWDDNEFSLSASIGLLELESNVHTGTELMSMVDLACLQAKSQGLNRIVISTLNDEAYSQRKGEMLWMPRLRHAIDNNAFELYQQVVVRAGNSVPSPMSNATHVEILLRMRDKDGTLILPHEFIDAAERYDMMAEIDRWVIHNVITRMAGKASDTSITQADFVAINLSGQSLADPSLLDFIQKEIDLHSINASRLCFEVTETNAIANQTNAIRLMKNLKAQGCQFALDDFGSGLSSYSYIKNLPADYLKIDRSFTKNLVTDEINRAIVQSVIDVARNIGMKSIAEGVEDEESQHILENLGVDYMQGFWLGLPYPVESTDTKIRESMN
jgi:diguanylate cyclase (GGDEF)-like protein/PAS domain S-box-containing protein